MPRICSRVGPQALRLVSPTPDPDLCSAESPLIVGQAPIVKKCACPIWQSYGRVCHRSLRELSSNLQLIGIFCMQLPFSAPAISARSTPAHYYCSISISFAGESISSLHFLPLPPHGMGWDGFCRHRFTSVLARASSVSSSWDPASACCLDMTHLDRRMHLLHPTPANLSISFPARYTSPTLHPDVPLPVSLLHSCPSQALLSSSSHVHPRDPTNRSYVAFPFHSACAPSPSITSHSPVPAFSLSNPVRLP